MKIISILCVSLSLVAVPPAASTNPQRCVRESELPDGKTQVRRIKPCCYFKKLLKLSDDAVSMMALPCVPTATATGNANHSFNLLTCILKPAGQNHLYR
jgi:hypothetical protein